MKIIFDELNAEPNEYLYPYQIWGIKEEQDTLATIYNLGFLGTRRKKNWFYMARSLRINLNGFSFTSENRRILRKTDGLKIENIINIAPSSFSPIYAKEAKIYYQQKTDKNIFMPSVMKRIFEDKIFTHIFSFSMDEKVCAWCVINMDEQILHYAYPFYRLNINKDMAMGLMVRTIWYALKKGLQYVYLGTVYKNGRYKLQFNNLEWWDGKVWRKDIAVLKDLLKKDVYDN